MEDLKPIVVLDSRIEDSALLLAQLPRHCRWLFIHPEDDGLQQIVDFLARSSSELTAPTLHILCHGEPGSLLLGSTAVTCDNVYAHHHTLAAIGDCLSTATGPAQGVQPMTPEIFLYACQAGSGAKGRRLIEQLAAFTGAQVAANALPTGPAALGGCWELTIATAAMQSTALAFPAYPHLLAVVNGGSGNDPLNGSAGDDTVNGLGGNDTITASGGNDLIDGGTGVDRVNYDALFGGFSFSQLDTAFAPLVLTSQKGADSLVDVELLTFTDATVEVIDSPTYEFQVNTTTTDAVIDLNVVALPDGGWLVCWVAGTMSHASKGVYGQRYSAAGAPVGAEFKINTTPVSYTDVDGLSVQVLQDGGWVAVWSGPDGDQNGLFGQRYDASGAAEGGEFRIDNQSVAGHTKESPKLAALNDGGWVTIWEVLDTTNSYDSVGVFGQRFNNSGQTVGTVFKVDSHPTAEDYADPEIAALANGGWVVVWQNLDTTTINAGNDLYARIYDANGVATGPQFLISSPAVEERYVSSILALPNGDWIVTWVASPETGANRVASIKAQRFNAEGDALSDEFQVNAPANYDNWGGRIVSLQDGGWLITWTSYEDGLWPAPATKSMAKRYDAAGTPVGEEFELPATYALTEGLNNGGWASFWSDDDQNVIGQIFDQAGAPVASGSSYRLEIEGDSSSQTLKGWENDDLIYGLNGNDILDGGPGADSIYGGAGNDSIYPGLGHTDQMYGEQGDDKFFGYLFLDNRFDGGDGYDIVKDTLGLPSKYYTITATAEGFTLFLPFVTSSYSKYAYLVGIEEIQFSDKTISLVNRSPTGLPVITGSTSKGQTLSVDNSGIADPDGLGAFSHQWLRDGTSIQGATASTYTLAQADVGHKISVRVSYKDGGVAGGTTESLTSAATATVTAVNSAPTGNPTIDGAATEGALLTANTAAIADSDGLGAFSYQWLNNGQAIVGATASTYQLVQADVDDNISLRVTYLDGGGTTETLTSTAKGPVANVNDLPTGGVSIQGNAAVGATLQAVTASLADEDGLGTLSYQWLRDSNAIAGATSNTYVVTVQDDAHRISLRVSYEDKKGTDESVLSGNSLLISHINSPPTGTLTITGNRMEGEVLTANANTIQDADGLGSFSYQWLRDNVPITGATAASYLLGSADVGKKLSVTLRYTDDLGTAETLSSQQTTPIDAPDDGNNDPTGTLFINGAATLGMVMSAVTGSLADLDGLGTLNFQWLRDGQAIPGGGATFSRYQIQQADVDKAISVKVSYVDGAGHAETLVSEDRIAVIPLNEAYTDLIEMYVVILGRAPDQEGLEFWSGLIDDGLSFRQVAEEMWASAGAQAEYPPSLSDEDKVAEVYRNVLARDPDEEGLQFWLTHWQSEDFGPVGTMLAIIEALTANNSTDPQAIADKVLFQAKVDIGGYLATSVGNEDIDLAAAAFAYLEAGNSIGATRSYIDDQMPLIGQLSGVNDGAL